MMTLTQLFERQGTSRALTAQDQLWLDNGSSLYRVSAGEADVYLAWRDEQGNPGRRHFIGYCPTGAVIPAWGTPGEAGWQLMLGGQLDTRLQEISEDDLEDDDDQYMELVETMSDWLMLLYKPLRNRLPPEEVSRFQSGEVGQLNPGAAGIIVGKGNWLALGQGTVHVYASEALTLRAGDFPLPLPPHCWLLAVNSGKDEEEQVVFQTMDVAEVLDFDPDMESFVLATQRLTAGLAEHFKETEQEERQRMQQRVEVGQAVMTGGLQTLAAVLRKKHWRPEFRAEEGPWFGACRMVAEAAGIQLKNPGPGIEESKNPLSVIENTNGVLHRMVSLEGQWWKHDNGPMLGYMKDGKPVALIPRKNRRSYEVHDPETQKIRRVDAKVNEELMGRGYTFYRPFGDIKPSPFGVMKFAFTGMRPDFIMFLFAAALGVLLGFAVPVVTGLLVDDIIPGADRDRIAEITLLLIALAVAVGMFEITKGLTQLRLEGRMETAAQSAVWDRLLRLPTSFFRRYTAGDLASRANGFADIRSELSGTALSSLLDSFFSIFALVLMLIYSPKLTLVVIGLALIAVIINIIATIISLAYERRMAENEGELSGMTLELLSGVSKIRASGAEQRAFARWSQVFARQQENSYRAGAAIRPISALQSAFPLLSTIVIFVVAARMIEPGIEGSALTTGQFIAFSAAQGMFIGGVLGLSDAVASLISIVPLWERAKPILTHPPEVSSGKSDPGRLQGRIEVHDVEFSYSEDMPQILRGVSLTVEPGEFIGIVGTSGSGKSTLLRLLLGFETPQSGSIYYDGQDMSGLALNALRKQIGVVLQNGYLMQGDIFTNIVGSSPLKLDDAWEAVRMAGMESDIKNMPMGLHTMVSEGGGTLSGGQRQRLLIARALVHKPRVLFFDEATSALDNKTQAQVNESVEQLDATRIVIAHRLSTIMHADRIYVMDAGRVAESGSFDELMELDGIFAELARRQIV